MGTAGKAAARVLVITRVLAPQGLVLIEDSGGGERPSTIPGQLVASTANAIAVACAASGATAVTVGEFGLVPAGAGISAFDGRLPTPTRKLAVRTILGATLLEVIVPSADTHVRIWTNAAMEPSEITIAIARAAGAVAR